MTVSTTILPREAYTGNAVTKNFAVPFVFQDEEDLVVVVTTSGVDSTKVLGVDYTVTGGGQVPATGSIVFGTAPASGTTITIYRETNQTQTTDYIPYDLFPADAHEAALDKLTLIIQEQQDDIGRAVLMAPSSGLSGLLFPSPSASKVIAWNASATALENVTLSNAVININSLSTETSIDAAADFIPFYDTSAASNKKILPNNIPVNISGLTADAAPDGSTDYVITYDASAASNKKVLINNLPTLSGAPTNASYVVIGTNGTLTAERVLTADTGIAITDTGAGNPVTVGLNVNALTADASPVSSTDYTVTYDASASTHKKVLLDNFPININGLTTDSSPDVAADYLATYDVSASTNKKVLLNKVSGFVLLQTTTVSSAVAQVDITSVISSTYSRYMLVLADVMPATDNVALLLRVSTDNGSSFLSTNIYAYALQATATGAATQTGSSTGTSSFGMTTGSTNVGNTSAEGVANCHLWLQDPANASTRTSFNLSATSWGTDTTIRNVIGGGNILTAGAHNALRFFFSSGNISSGVFKIYGVL